MSIDCKSIVKDTIKERVSVNIDKSFVYDCIYKEVSNLVEEKVKQMDLKEKLPDGISVKDLVDGVVEELFNRYVYYKELD